MTKKIPSRKSIPPFESLRAFDAVARLGGIRKAATSLLRDHAVVSRHLKTVEDWTGCQLFDRTPGGAVLTKEGSQYHKKISASIDMIAEATNELLSSSDQNSIQITCIPGFALHWLVLHLGDFETLHPNVKIEFRSAHEAPDFERGETDIDIRLFDKERLGKLPPGLRKQAIAYPEIVPVASPEYLKNHPVIENPRDLLAHDLLHEADFEVWRLWLAGNKVEPKTELKGTRLWDGHMTLAAATQSMGIALTNTLIVEDSIKSGKLVRVDQLSNRFKTVSMGNYYLISKRDRWSSSACKAFRDWLVGVLEQ